VGRCLDGWSDGWMEREIRRNMVNADKATDNHIIRRLRSACWITKAPDAHSEHTNTRHFRKVGR
jgi:hypothetical protein